MYTHVVRIAHASPAPPGGRAALGQVQGAGRARAGLFFMCSSSLFRMYILDMHSVLLVVFFNVVLNITSYIAAEPAQAPEKAVASTGRRQAPARWSPSAPKKLCVYIYIYIYIYIHIQQSLRRPLFNVFIIPF